MVIGERYVAAIGLHLTLFSFSMYFICKENFNETRKKLGLFTEPLKQIGYGIAGFIVIVILAILLNLALYYVGFNDEQKIVDTVQGFPFYLVVFAIVFAPISEEVFFRAFLLTELDALLSGVLKKFRTNSVIKYTPLFLALVITSALFASAHFAYGSIAQFLGAFLIGACLGLIYKRTNSIVPVMLAHFLFNLLSLTLIKSTYGFVL